MFEKSEMLYFYVETPLHAGSGGSVGVVDLPIQRERVTHYPLVQASGIKGKLRAEAYEWDQFVQLKNSLKPQKLAQLRQDAAWQQRSPQDQEREAEKRARKDAAKQKGLEAVFGPEGDEADHHAGALSPGDARLLLFPVRSLVGVFAWTTSRLALERLRRDLQAAGKSTTVKVMDNGQEVEKEWHPVGRTDKDDNTALVCRPNDVVASDSDKVVLEEFTFPVKDDCDQVPLIAKWLAENAFPNTSEYDYFRQKVQRSLVILPEDAFRDFTQFATEVVTRIRIDQSKGTVAQGALWTEEHLPSDTLLYAPLHATRPRTDTSLFNDDDGKPSGAKVLEFVKNLNLGRIQLGGDETVGRGIVKLRISNGAPSAAAQTSGGAQS